MECYNATIIMDQSPYLHPTNHDDCASNQLIDDDEYYDDGYSKIHAFLPSLETL